jgi:hypothetical protein
MNEYLPETKIKIEEKKKNLKKCIKPLTYSTFGEYRFIGKT